MLFMLPPFGYEDSIGSLAAIKAKKWSATCHDYDYFIFRHPMVDNDVIHGDFWGCDATKRPLNLII